jgi:adenosylcobinamide-GDP ribazoletransferase
MSAADSERVPKPGSLITQIRLAAGFLTILPLMPDAPAAEPQVQASYAWFPLVGLAMGVAFALEDYALSYLFGHAIRSTLIVLSVAVLSGGVHLDAVADTADALGAGRDRERALEILRDSNIGSFGAGALFFILALKVLSLASLAGTTRYLGLITSLTLARWAMVAVTFHLDYLRVSGAGSALGLDSERNLKIASATALIPAALFLSRRVAWCYLAAIIAVVVLRRFYSRWLGGVTGDLIGACGEIVETLMLMIFAA